MDDVIYPSAKMSDRRGITMHGLTDRQKVWLFAGCVVASAVQGIAVLEFHTLGDWLLYFGLPGALPLMLLTGAHGEIAGVSGLLGAVLYVFINGGVYYGLGLLLMRLQPLPMRRRRARTRKMVRKYSAGRSHGSGRR